MEKTKIEFFNLKELKLFKEKGKKRYDKKNQDDIDARKYIYNSIFKKTNYWGEQIVPKGFVFRKDTAPFLNDYRNMIFKPYTWARIYRVGDEKKFIFFTFGVDAENMSLLYKIDCQWNDKNKFLDNIQIEKFRDIIKDSPAKRIEILPSQIDFYDWGKLISESKKFIQDYTELYDKIVKYIWDDELNVSGLKNQLILHDPPKGEFDNNGDANKKRRLFDIDFEKRNKENKELGDFGEEMVKQYEIDSLKAADRPEFVNRVKKVKDGAGYDIESVDKFGNIKYIEVKTTKKNKIAPFPISANEYNFLVENKNNAYIYRLYNARIGDKRADMFIMDYKYLNKEFNKNDLTYIMKKK